jgi:ubiquinol-cytochrome c reductase cytochrome b subunit
VRRVLDWIHARTGYRAGLAHLLDEPLPPGTGWWFTLGSVLLFLLALQLLTGVGLALYYAPTPDHAYQSVKFITEEVVLGRFVRGLHFFGASAIVIFVALHMLRVIAFGSYKAPREVTWLTGLVLLNIVLAFALTGYLLPWDQRAYWATVVSVNITKLVPFAGSTLANLAGAPGGHVGALTLSRWFALHVIVLPAVLVLLVVSHLYLLRRHGISGPVRERAGLPVTFYPYQAARDLTVILCVAVVLGALAWRGLPALERMADPTDAAYVPRPEWYFLGLFQLLKFMPGRLEIFGALILPGLVMTLLALLPWLDRAPERDLRRRPIVLGGVIAGVISLVGLTAAGWRDRPPRPPAGEWSLREIAGASLATTRNCGRCHASGRSADPLARLAVTRPVPWIQNHVADPEVIAPGIRPMPESDERAGAAMIAYVRRGDTPPAVPEPTRQAAIIFAVQCVGCHTIDGDGGTDGPDLSGAGRKHDLAWLRRWIARPEAVKADAKMPAFDRKLTPDQIETIAAFLAKRGVSNR